MMKFACKALALSLVVAGSSFAMAGDSVLAKSGVSFSGSAALTSDYRFRGISQTENDPAVQVGFQLDHESGLYAGAWGSNVSLGDGHLELDPYIGFATELPFAGKPTLDVGLWYYGYPGSEENDNFLEIYTKLGFDNAVVDGDNILATVNFTNDFAGSDENGWYLSLGYSVPFADTGFGGVVGVGYTKVDHADFSGQGDDDFIDWKAGMTYGFKSIEGFSAELAAIGTNIDTKGWTKSAKRPVETGAVFTLTKSF